MSHTPLDLQALRAATPGTAHVAHLNNAGSALPTTTVTNTVVAHLRREEEIGGYEAAAQASDSVAATFQSIATLLGTVPERIAFVDSATTAWLRAFTAVPLQPGDRILMTQAEYASNVLQVLSTARRAGVRVETIPDGADGTPDPQALAAMLDDDVAIVAVTQTPSHNGLIADAAAIGETLRAAGSRAFYLLDGCQSVGQLRVDVEAIGCDAFSATGRKFLRAPRGTGFLYAGPRLLELEPSTVDLHSAEWTDDTEYVLAPDARRFETWERPYALLLGLGAAVDEFLALGPALVEDRIRTLAVQLRDRLSGVPGVTVRDRGNPLQRSGIVTFSHDRVEAADIVARLRGEGINTSLSTADYSIPDFRAEGITAKVRASPHIYNNDADIDRLIHVIEGL